MKSELVKYLEAQAHRPRDADICLMPIIYSDQVYGIEIRFTATMYGHRCEEEDFKSVVSTILDKSGETLKVSSTWEDFWSGVLSLKVAFCNHEYDDDIIIDTLQLLITEIIPSFEK